MDWLTILLILFSTIGTCIFFWFKYNDSVTTKEFAKRNLKYVKMSNMFTSMVKKEKIHVLKSEAIKREGPVFGFTMLNKYTIMVAEPDIVQTVLSKEFTNFTNRRIFPAFFDGIDENLFVVLDEKWKRLRSIVTPAFSVGKLKQMKPYMDETIKTMLGNIETILVQSSTQNVKNIFDAFTMDTIIQVAFGVKVDTLNDPKNPIIVMGRKIFQQDIKIFDMIKLTIVFMMPGLGKLLKMDLGGEETKFFTKLSVDIMNQKRVEYSKTKNFTKASSFIEFMLEAEEEGKAMGEADENGKKPTKYMTKEEVVAQCVLFFFAGFDTTASTLALAAYHLARNPEKQEKLYQETMAVIEKLKTEYPDESDIFKLISYDSQSKFEYLNAVINETMRLDSIAIFLERTASRDMELANADESVKITVKEGDVIHIPIWSLHRDPKNFVNPEEFKPERFIGEPDFHKYAYLPFGAGPRNCVARSMALLQVRFALLHVVRNYKFELSEQTKIPPEFNNLFDSLTPLEIKLQIVKRN